MPMLRREAAVAALLFFALAAPLPAKGLVEGGAGPPVLHGPNVGPLVEGWNLELIEVTPNRAWWFPHAGYTLYPGQAGSGWGTRSDYSHINWLVPPEQNAALVRERLRLMNIPPVPPEPVFLNKNPAILEGLRLPIPRPKTPPKDDKEPDK